MQHNIGEMMQTSKKNLEFGLHLEIPLVKVALIEERKIKNYYTFKLGKIVKSIY